MTSLIYLITLSFLAFASASTIPYNLNDQCTYDVFNTSYCVGTLQGAVDGERCFFFIPPKVNWTYAWTMCSTYGAVLAQIQTESEYNAVKQLMLLNAIPVNMSISWLWIGLQRDQSAVGQPCGMTLNSTYWYDDSITPNSQMYAGNTWIRYHSCDNEDLVGNKYCFQIGFEFPANVSTFNASKCGPSISYGLCQLTNPSQNYTHTNICMMETPIETFTGTQAGDCAKTCSERIWCRSFNFFTCTNLCQLFSWSIYDTCPNCATTISAAGTNCYHYNYVP